MTLTVILTVAAGEEKVTAAWSIQCNEMTLERFTSVKLDLNFTGSEPSWIGKDHCM